MVASTPVRSRRDCALTDRFIASIKKPGVYVDGGGLALHVLDTGTRSWRFRYRLDGRAAIAVFGTYPEMSLAKARAALEDARRNVKAGIRPVGIKHAENHARRATRATGSTLGDVAEQWFEMAKADAWSDSTAMKTRGRLDLHIKPTALWQTPIRNIDVAMVTPLLDKLHREKPDTAKKVKQILNGIFRWAAARGIVVHNPIPETKPGSGMRGRKAMQRDGKRLPAVTEQRALGDLLRKIDQAQASWQVRGALFLCAMTAQRPGRVVAARWEEFKLTGKNPVWIIPRDLQKNSDGSRGDHVVPLAPQVVDWLKTLPSTSEFVFETAVGHVTLEAPSKLLRSLGFAGTHTPHGFRSSFSTLANAASRPDGSRMFDRVDIEHVLDHETLSDTVRSYDRARAVPRLRVILEWWASTLIEARDRK
ncbi:integrase arm-type DNA-binding domain-containing protein [Lysobacter sp. A6]|uniref:Integrase arm-type DNA-binding domain-containing protein n=1 Tax=Noviluteimonas lactosilytica TaxID=2888523 RepID=A0ABS8JID7_9GAMM|nr:integrase arm-type DNA-binding domain-containing protein [Lysobacter lactosilyticus]MCC8363322.1 integrase arm-type DNA-binding domain-containing protein [Lysobacter lactosilyticus]